MRLGLVISTTSQHEIDALHKIYNSTGGSNWNFVEMNKYITAWANQFNFLNLTGTAWDFSTDSSGKYVSDPCAARSTKRNFAGIGCQCVTVNTLSSCKITEIGLPGGNLKGSLESIIGALKNYDLTYFDVDTNALTGSIPDTISAFTNLRLLDMDDNQLTGPIPVSFGKLKKLQQLYLFFNSLTGTIPSSIGNFTELESVSFDNNKLQGTIPQEVLLLTKLTNIYLYDNKLTGTIPSLGSLPSLVTISFQSNALTGTIPSSFTRLRNLTHLILNNNELESSESDPFNFIDPLIHTKLSVLDLSSNKLSGQILNSIFSLPSLENLFLGYNCFSGSIPDNMCAATKLMNLDMSQLASAPNCRRYIWKDFPALRNVFNAFRAGSRMTGAFPECAYLLPKLKTLHASGNLFAGTLPTVISTSLVDLTMSRNRLEGTISKALCESHSLKTLDLANNHITGDLAGFQDIQNDKLSLKLQLNHLSGDIPKALLNLDFINILTGNLFSCSYDRSELPVHNPNKSGYQCGSTEMNNMMYSFAGISGFASIIFLLIRQSLVMKRCFDKFKLWLRIAAGQESLSKVMDTTNMMRFSWHLQVQRWFVLIIALAMVIVNICYLSLSGKADQIVSNSYSWVMTGAYLTGRKSVVVVLSVGIIFLCFVWVLIFLDERVAPEKVDDNPSDDDARELPFKEKLRVRLLTALRLLIIFPIVHGVIISFTIWYVNIQQDPQSSRAVQKAFKFLFGGFRLVWSHLFTPWLFERKWLYFGVSEKHHDDLLRKLFGTKVQLSFTINVVNIFIPIIFALAFDTSCFKYAFVQPPAVQTTTYVQGCAGDGAIGSGYSAIDGVSSAFCTNVILIPKVIQAVLPFTYGYTCSDSILRIFIPLYMQMAVFLISRSVCAVGYLVWDTYETEKPIHSVVEGKMHAFMNLILNIVPLKYLTYDNQRRRTDYRPEVSGKAYVTMTRGWMTKGFGFHLANTLLLLSFGFAAPPLAYMMIITFVMDSYVYQLLLGRFLEAEIGVVLEHKRQTAETDAPYKPEVFTISLWRRERMHDAIKDISEPWGAIAAVQEVEGVCSHVPNSALSLGRFVFILIPATLISLLLIDIENSGNNDRLIWWAAAAMFSAGSAILLFTMVNKKFGLLNCGLSTKKMIEEQVRASPSMAKKPSSLSLSVHLARIPSKKASMLDVIPAVVVNDDIVNPISQRL